MSNRLAYRRIPVAPPIQQRIEKEMFVAPTRGWIADENLAAGKRGGALRLENWFTTQNSIRLRAGSELFATIGTDPVTALFNYKSGATERFFAADEENIFNITAVADPKVAPTADVTTQTSGEYSTVQFETAAGDFLYAVNGADEAQLYDGASWAAVNAGSVPAITGVLTSDLSQVNVYRNRIYFVEGGTMSAWYLPVDSLGGAAVEISLRGVFQKGGALLFMATWSLDAGDGVDDKAVFVSTEGEAAVYEGSYPGGADWSLVGRYDLSPPLGKNATMRAGGDLLIATKEGIVPISAAITKDTAALSLAAVTRKIEPEWKRELLTRGTTLPWSLLKWPAYNMAIVGLPTQGTLDPNCLVVNIETGAWAKYTGWDTRCLGLFSDWAYFGTADGTILKCESTGSDNGAPYQCIAVHLFDHLKDIGPTHLIHQVRSTFLSSRTFTPKASVSVNYVVSLPAAPSAAPNESTGNEWDVGLWDTAVWDAAGDRSVTTRWTSVGKNGFVVAPQMQVTCGQTAAPDAELISMELTYEHGGLVV